LTRDIDRRGFIRPAGTLGAAAALGVRRGLAVPLEGDPLVVALRDSLTPAQASRFLLPWSDPRRTHAANNWHVVPETIGRAYSTDQRQLISDIVRSLTSDDGHDRLTRSMRDDAGGIDNYSAALFADDSDRLAFVLTGRHMTMRADAGASGAPFGGPVFYGHAVEFNERPEHPGNVWWRHARAASEVYYALDEADREVALVAGPSPRDVEHSVRLDGAGRTPSGVSVGALADDQQKLVSGVLDEMLAPYRELDVDAVWKSIQANGGVGGLRLTFYSDGDLPDESGVWDRWKVEGPGLAWYFRGSPHVHAWLNVGAA
jgi:hypothetical protein